MDIDADRLSRKTGLSAGGGIGEPSSWRMQSRGMPRAVSTGTVNAPKTYMDTMISTIVVVAKSVRWSCAFGNVCAQEKATAPRNPENQSMCCIAGGISPAVAGCCSSLRGDSCARSSRFSSPKGSPRLSSVASAWEKEFDRRLACSFLKRLLICRDLRGHQHFTARSRQPPRHRRDTCSMAYRSTEPAWPRHRREHLTLVDFHTAQSRGYTCAARPTKQATIAQNVKLWE